jgi:SAM-dependent methyltransferase
VREDQPDLTDERALSAHRQRTAHDPARFLHDEAMLELQERLIDVNRRFNSPAIVTDFPKIWREFLPEAKFVDPEPTLKLKTGAHDLVIHAMSLHWANDPVGQIVQCRRALKPDGLFLGVGFGGATLSELRAVMAEAEAQVMGGISPRVAPMAEVRDMGSLLQRAGLALPVADSLRKRVTYPNAIALMHDLRAMGEGNALADRHRSIPPRALFPTAATLYAKQHSVEENRIQATFELVFLTGWAPHESQQQPLRPGAATHRLADALGTDEISAPTPARQFDETAKPVHDRPDDESP